ncbi:hypothetical protein [Hydrogenimonas sp.]
MENRCRYWGLGVCVALIFAGCGGGGGPNGGKSDPSASSMKTGKAYYVDAPVGGIGYLCGSQQDVTDDEGGFIFDEGKGCLFYLGGVKLRKVEAARLKDGETIQETDEKIARLLQSLDTDGDPENGITINDALVKKLSDTGYDHVPDSKGGLQAMFDLIAEEGGHVVSVEAARAHLLRSILRGKTLYCLRYDAALDTDAFSGWKKVRIDFNESSFDWYDPTENGEYPQTFAYAVDKEGNILLSIDEAHGGPVRWKVEEITENNIKICENERCGLYLFYDEKNAESFIHATTVDSDVVTLATISGLNERLRETSGLAYVEGRLFTHNDGGNANLLYQIDTKTGRILRTVMVNGASNVDWEDLAYDGSYLYIADIGNNMGDRKDLKIYRIPKDDILSKDEVQAEIISLAYADQKSFDYEAYTTPYDAEALVAYDSALYIFTKNWGDYTTRVYKVPSEPGSYRAEAVDKRALDIMITGAAYDEKSHAIALIGYTNPYDEKRSFKSAVLKLSGFSDDRFFSGRIVESPIKNGRLAGQVESLAFRDSSTFFISAEGISTPWFEVSAKLYELRLPE